MEKMLEKGQDKIDKICKILRNETLEPAQKEAKQIVEEAKVKAAELLRQAEGKAQALVQEAQKRIEQERAVFHGTLKQASEQSVETLRQSIEKLFQNNLEEILEKQTSDPQVIAKFIAALVHAIEKEGMKADLDAVVSNNVSPQEINELLARDLLQKLQKESVTLGDFVGGVQLKWLNKNITLVLTAESLRALLASHISNRGMRDIFFQKG